MQNNTQTTFQVDVCWDDFESPWQALVALWRDFDVADVTNVRWLSDSGAWPTFEVTTETEETARCVLANYLEVGDPYGEEVTEYLNG
jgi:hypothetical protein